MSDTLSCPECEKEIDSFDDLEKGENVAAIEQRDGGALDLFGNRDLFLCKDCKKPLGVSR